MSKQTRSNAIAEELEKIRKDDPKPVARPDTTRLTIVITEDSFNGMSVETEAVSVETGQPIKMRHSHVLGQLMDAIVFLSIDHYTTLRDQILSSRGLK